VTSWDSVNQNSPVNPYHVLELRRDATPAEIIGSYRKLALIYHPGRKISCPLERKKRIQFFEVLAACYETLMHSEFRRKCDLLLKDVEKKQHSKSNHQRTRSIYETKMNSPESIRKKSQPQQLLDKPYTVDIRDTNLIVKGGSSIPGLIPSTSSSSSLSGEKCSHSVENSGESVDTLPTQNCTYISGIITCVAGQGVPNGKSSTNNSFTISRHGIKGFKSLVDSSSLSVSHSQASTEEEAEIHFSEATVNRLFGGPLASLHRARNFQAFSDPYVVFDKVFGNKRPLFPRVTAADVTVSKEESLDEVENFDKNGSNSLFRPAISNFSHPRSEPVSSSKQNQDRNKNNSFRNNNDYDPVHDLKVFISSRVVNGRKITKTETVHVDSMTGIASVNVTVDGEYLERERSRKKSSQLYETSVADWLLCFGNAKVVPASRSKRTTEINSSPFKSSFCCPYTATTENLQNSYSDIKSIYADAIEELYLCNDNFYEECNKYMQCGTAHN